MRDILVGAIMALLLLAALLIIYLAVVFFIRSQSGGVSTDLGEPMEERSFWLSSTPIPITLSIEDSLDGAHNSRRVADRRLDP
jgi:hypothetical protein